ncbi:MAG: fibrobacter succinogenes major paralogous domain-containing protein [Flavobacteriales bacterium]|jgi:uncharacterized protein (TIGR02145 family)|nr:fibrobacter succinogenes major paralogous domain-containing protein [Flavobacteriales bacterium]
MKKEGKLKKMLLTVLVVWNTDTMLLFSQGRFCEGFKTLVVEVYNPITNKVWMDRNLGAAQAAISCTDSKAYGDLYQWGRFSDGHQCRKSPTTNSKTFTDKPIHDNFIVEPYSPWDWMVNPSNELWRGGNRNNPCPKGYRLPSDVELDFERKSWKMNNGNGAFASPLRFTLGGYRSHSDGSLNSVGSYGCYWSSTVSGARSNAMLITSNDSYVFSGIRANGLSVRCIKDN